MTCLPGQRLGVAGAAGQLADVAYCPSLPVCVAPLARRQPVATAAVVVSVGAQDRSGCPGTTARLAARGRFGSVHHGVRPGEAELGGQVVDLGPAWVIGQPDATVCADQIGQGHGGDRRIAVHKPLGKPGHPPGVACLEVVQFRRVRRHVAAHELVRDREGHRSGPRFGLGTDDPAGRLDADVVGVADAARVHLSGGGAQRRAQPNES